MSSISGDGVDAKVIADAVRHVDPSGVRFARVVRATLDQAYDGVHSGRYRWSQLRGAERTHSGAMLAIDAQREFGFGDSDSGDFRIGSSDVEVVFDPLPYALSVPSRLVGAHCLAVCADDPDG